MIGRYVRLEQVLLPDRSVLTLAVTRAYTQLKSVFVPKRSATEELAVI